MSGADLDLPPSLDLPPHLSAYKYFYVCTLTVAAWDTLVLSPRTWKLFRTQEWPALKLLFHFLRILMPIEFTIVGVAFFDTNWSQQTCQKFFLFEPICTAVLLAAASAVHVIRVHAIYDKNRSVLLGMGALFAAQVVVTGVCCGFYRSVPLKEGQGCVAGIKHEWVGIYWVAPTIFYLTSLALAVNRSLSTPQSKSLGLWRLMLRDGLNFYGAIAAVQLVNMLFLFIMKPTDDSDPVKTIVTSMATVLTTSMTMRIILSVRGSLVYGGTYTTTAESTSTRTTHALSTRSGGIGAAPADHTYTLDRIRSSREGGWSEASVKDDDKGAGTLGDAPTSRNTDDDHGVKVTVDRQIGFDMYNNRHA
ncbi:hypothetical protein CYLTODRAFT_369191 [Cylindrobasidium torrendii FP15055 ss-10]|uniref:DUF6533 domain-containing protein n=1 Tax=Cylindrobasidium torrendii FP15055 ss-10 TaxID=1314674 RepID=A0A0D7BMX9_9AGAR|nr:hypothetical protein CYLTODRAFT_369191 [Cylindrobasidium torrendii FP15055 ss-10]